MENHNFARGFQWSAVSRFFAILGCSHLALSLWVHIPPQFYQLHRSSPGFLLLFLHILQDPISHFSFGCNLKEDGPVIFLYLKGITKVVVSINATWKGERQFVLTTRFAGIRITFWASLVIFQFFFCSLMVILRWYKSWVPPSCHSWWIFTLSVFLLLFFWSNFFNDCELLQLY